MEDALPFMMRGAVTPVSRCCGGERGKNGELAVGGGGGHGFIGSANRYSINGSRESTIKITT